ncbi:hypothetical protein GETHLI_23260 [Geothrix limicola]|uniref:Glycoside hydrolase family 42 N-terminal domain-containing protein n=1 Tax=Geothrix limicola TaxID=2927978 RepID=A0ABQ5QG53_9BACT|nr:hypothetical protein [Geothrix limicola]GLH73824.1 hypothetical protein GETHLI_23260 [Geothrix limicola]
MRINIPGALLVLVLGVSLGLRAQAPRPRVTLFQSEGFPSVDRGGLSDDALKEALQGLSCEVDATPETLSKRLQAGTDVLVLPYGSAFPLAAWEAIRAHLERGGGLVVLGGAPFHQPVLWQVDPGAEPGKPRGRWVLGRRQPTFARELLIGPAEELSAEGLGDPKLAIGSPWTTTGTRVWPRPSRTFALTVRFATRKDQPREDGSAGSREALLRPLLHMADADGTARACPLLEIDRLRGLGSGGRWVLAPSDAPLNASMVRACLLRALEGPSDLDVRPINACLEPGEWPRFRVNLHRPGAGAEAVPATIRAILRDGLGQEVAVGEASLAGPRDIRHAELVLRPAAPLPPGLYRLEAGIPGSNWRVESGVWVKDERLLKEGPALTASRDWLRLDGQVFPVIGTTYMASDVHRKFLFEPNPALWDRDFEAMQRQGVNFVRTGLWTAWDRLMLDPGALDDTALRALDAFVLTAAKHRMPLCFTFFAFLPPAFGGENPYLDSRALEGQKRLLALVASRYRGCPWVHYDLINEPSCAPADALWTNRPNLDRFEFSAWRIWVEAHLGTDPSLLRDLWLDGSEEVLGLPRVEELSQANFKEGKRPRKVRDFRIFTQELFARWASEMRGVLREAGGDVLVTVGQDEAGLLASPSQQLMAPSLDYTAIHTWWATDDLLWDCAAAKVPEKPMLAQETGLMRLEDVDGAPWRSPEEAARLLERKFAAAFGGRGTGAVEWAWNVNPYQPLENEAVIGFLRPDGTAKAETRVLRTFADFFAKAAPRLGDYAPDGVVLVYPQSRIFAGRPFGPDGAKRMVRVLADRFGLVPTLISDLALDASRLQGARLILVPMPEMLDEAAARALLKAQEAGALILVTGAVSGDAHGRLPEALRELGIVDAGRPLSLREPTPWGGWATFDGNLGERLRRSLAPDLKDPKARLWHEPLPLEFAREEEPLARLLGAALKAAGLPPAGTGGPAASRVLDAGDVSLVVCLNEAPVDVRRSVKVGGHSLEVPVAAGRTRLLLMDRSSGKVLAETPGAPLRVR